MKSKFRIFYMILPALALLAAGCTEDDPMEEPGNNIITETEDEGIVTRTGGDRWYPMVASTALPAPDGEGNIIPDFSRVGYQWGDKEIPATPVVATLYPPESGDAGAYIQNTIDSLAALAIGDRGAILLTAGDYNIAGRLNITASNIVLRGEGRELPSRTRLIATGTSQRSFINIRSTGSRTPTSPTHGMNITDDYVPAGRFWVRVNNPDLFNPGDNVVIYRPGSALWISEIKMDQIPVGTDTEQWAANDYIFQFERVVTMIHGDTLHFENPVVMAMESRYGGGAVFKYDFPGRISECGVENLLLESEYAHDTDEDHAWTGIELVGVEHCWVKEVTALHFGYALVTVNSRSKNVTIADCICADAKSQLTGSRRYSFNNNGSLTLFTNCLGREGRHDFVTGPRQGGPNVFLRSKAVNAHSDSGPHHRWNMGTLYDNIVSDGQINIQDRGNSGTGHGWTGVNNVLWNCTASSSVVQSPWVSGYNYSIGTIASKSAGSYPDRPDGIWISPGTKVDVESLYEAQLELRRRMQPGGVMDIR